MPDLNSIPSAPHGLAAARARRTSSSQNHPSQQTLQPSSQQAAVTTSPSLNILPSNQQAFQEASSGFLPSPPPLSASIMPSASIPGQDNVGVGTGPGPIRHPRPLTAAELHSQLEQEQELIVNRLSRDLTMLRMAQNSSVVSNASSASTSAIDQLHPSSFTDTHILSGPGFPVSTSRRHHRTSSSASTRSLSQAATQGSSSAPIPIPIPHSGSAASALEAARNPRGPTGMSRQNSTTSHRSSSRNRSPQPYISGSSFLPSSHSHSHGPAQDYMSSSFHRDRTSSNASVPATPGSELSPGLMPGTLRFEETAHYRHELDLAKRENDLLKKRVRELEKLLREQRREGDPGAERARSESSNTTGNVTMSGITGVGGVVGGGTGVAGGRREQRRSIYRAPSSVSVTGSVAVGVPDEELKVGESAATTGISSEAAVQT